MRLACAPGRDQLICDPWHYLPILERKPGALRNGCQCRPHSPHIGRLKIPQFVVRLMAELHAVG
ncbi:MAG: hypothetical protein NVS2B11_10950 [Acetobacteraceae bacterium]